MLTNFKPGRYYSSETSEQGAICVSGVIKFGPDLWECTEQDSYIPTTTAL